MGVPAFFRRDQSFTSPAFVDLQREKNLKVLNRVGLAGKTR